MTSNDLQKMTSKEPERSFSHPPVGGGIDPTFDLQRDFGHKRIRTVEDALAEGVPVEISSLTAADVIEAAAPAQLSNFDQATFATMVELKAIDAEIERLDARKAVLRADLLAALKASDEGKIEFTDLGSASLTAGKTSVIVVDLALVPERFVKREPTVDTTAAGKALRAGGDVAGLKLSEAGEPSLRVVWAK